MRAIFVDANDSLAAVTEKLLRRDDPPVAINQDPDITPADLPRIAEKRGLEHLVLTGNVAMLRLLDTPAVLELQLPGVRGTRYAAPGLQACRRACCCPTRRATG